MRRLLFALFFLGSLGSARAAEVEFLRVWPEWRDAESFERISEYFTGKENPSGQIVRRTHPETRAGFYFLVRLRNPDGTQPAAKIVLSMIKPDAPQVMVYTFPVPLESGESVFNLGLTGADWPSKRTHPVAWKLEVVATDGTPLGVKKSFLWEKPDK